MLAPTIAHPKQYIPAWARHIMSWCSLNEAMGSNDTVDPGDIVNTKTALNPLGYYAVPPDRGIDDWTDDAMFNGIKAFQKDEGLKVDGFMRPGGPTENAINVQLGKPCLLDAPDRIQNRPEAALGP